MSGRFIALFPVVLGAAALIAGMTECSWSQDYQRIAPKELPKDGGIPGLPAPPSPNVGVGNPDDLLVPKLLGVVFVPAPDKVVAAGVAREGIVLDGVTVPDEAGLRALVTPYLGRPLTRRALDTLIADIVTLYRRSDRPVVDIIAPEQDVTTASFSSCCLRASSARS